MKNSSQANLVCPINLFPKQEKEIGHLTETLNHIPNAAGKAAIAQSLLGVVDVLIKCPSFDEENLNCSLCRNISELREKTYNLVVKAGNIHRS